MRKQYGLSLIELMISIVLGLILMTGVMKLFLSSKVVFSTQQGLSRIQETGRLATNSLARDISQAGYYGCHRPTARSSTTVLQGNVPNTQFLHSDFGAGLMGYDSVNDVPGGTAAFKGAAKITVDSPSVVANILVVRSASQVGLILNRANTPANLTAFSNVAPDANGCVSGICPGGVAVAADCFKSRVFRVNNVTSAGNVVTVTHPDAWGGGNNALDNFIAGDEIFPFSTTVYFLAEGRAKKGDSLWQKTNDQDAFELLEGVEQMRVTYAAGGSTVYNQAALVADWQEIWSVRVDLLVRSVEDNVLAEKQPYTFPGSPLTTPNDKRMRQIFTSTTALRNRMTLN